MSRWILTAVLVVAGAACAGEPGSAEPTSTTLEPLVVGSTLPPQHPIPGAPDLVGQCRVDASRRARNATSHDGPVVPCSQPHGLETFAAAPLPPEWRSSPYPDLYTAAYNRLADAGRQVCTTEAFDAYFGVRRERTEAGLRRPSGAIDWTPFIPTREQWAAGERWLRCDLHVAWDDPQGSFTGSLRGRYDELAATAMAASCVIGSDVLESRCDEPHALERVTTYTDVAGGRPAPDGDVAALDAWRHRCRADALRYLSTRTPAPGFDVDVQAAAPEIWAKGGESRTVTCRVGFRDGDQFIVITGSVRGLGDRAPHTV